MSFIKITNSGFLQSSGTYTIPYGTSRLLVGIAGGGGGGGGGYIRSLVSYAGGGGGASGWATSTQYVKSLSDQPFTGTLDYTVGAGGSGGGGVDTDPGRYSGYPGAQGGQTKVRYYEGDDYFETETDGGMGGQPGYFDTTNMTSQGGAGGAGGTQGSPPAYSNSGSKGSASTSSSVAGGNGGPVVSLDMYFSDLEDPEEYTPPCSGGGKGGNSGSAGAVGSNGWVFFKQVQQFYTLSATDTSGLMDVTVSATDGEYDSLQSAYTWGTNITVDIRPKSSVEDCLIRYTVSVNGVSTTYYNAINRSDTLEISLNQDTVIEVDASKVENTMIDANGNTYQYLNPTENGRPGIKISKYIPNTNNTIIAGTGKTESSSDPSSGVVRKYWPTTTYREVIYDNSITKIGENSLGTNDPAYYVYIGDNIGSSLVDCVSGGPDLSDYYVDEHNPTYETETSTKLIRTRASPITLVRCVKYGIQTLTIPDDITAIEKHAFEGCTSLREITFKDRNYQVGDEVFKGCTNLIQVNMPTSLTAMTDDRPNTIPEGFCDGCTRLQVMVIPDSTINIEDNAFRNTSVSDIILPPSVSYVGKGAFYTTTRTVNDEPTDIPVARVVRISNPSGVTSYTQTDDSGNVFNPDYTRMYQI